ncbi:hypothetical protein OJ996_08960 [Luteolibacter sp. GHJ8]|uniref:Uncharacterized protein n=1 Tax=Luteolibacter rhizosphaerae TaxID=2989719 RepID=A0ABT3G1I9_9BACT|nr:hypothetical protein [Luteolibacter rhizosphaerae]MCW1913702.1 hypothetical protein [Luteolibacter rhizosphaerae]
MSNTTQTAPGKGEVTGETLVDLEFALPTWLWELVKQVSREELITTDEVVREALTERFSTRQKMAEFEKSGIPEATILSHIIKAGSAAVFDHFKSKEEITIPLKLAVVPTGTLPVFLNERTVRYLRECAKICNVDADEWVEGWIGEAQVNDGLCGRNDVDFGGIGFDMVENHHDVDEETRSSQEKDELYEKLRGVAFRYQQELKAEALEDAVEGTAGRVASLVQAGDRPGAARALANGIQEAAASVEGGAE